MITSVTCTNTKGISFAIIMTMSSVGAVFYPPVLRAVLHSYQYSGGMLLLAAIMSHGFIGAMLCRDHSSNTYKEPTDRTHLLLKNHHETVIATQPHQEVSDSKPTLRHHPLYLSYCSCLGFTFMFSFLSLLTHLSRVCQSNLYDDSYDVTNLLFVIAVVDFIANLVFGCLFDYLGSPVRCINTYTFVSFCLAGSLVAMGLTKTEYSVYIATVAVVICSSCCYGQSMTIVVILLPPELVTTGVGALRVFQGVGAT